MTITSLNSVTALMLMTFATSAAAQSTRHPILDALQATGIEVPEAKQKQSLRVQEGNTFCAATVYTIAVLTGFHENYILRYDYSGSVDDSRDACSDAEILPVRIQFRLTFSESSDPQQISFSGQRTDSCSDCKPKRARSITGSVQKIGQRFLVTIEGDVSGKMEMFEVTR